MGRGSKVIILLPRLDQHGARQKEKRWQVGSLESFDSFLAALHLVISSILVDVKIRPYFVKISQDYQFSSKLIAFLRCFILQIRQGLI